MPTIILNIPEKTENGEAAEQVYAGLRRILKSRIFRNPIETSKIKTPDPSCIRVKISFYKEEEKESFLMMLNVLDYKTVIIEQEAVLK